MAIQRDPDIVAKKQEKVSYLYDNQISDPYRSEEEQVIQYKGHPFFASVGVVHILWSRVYLVGIGA